MKKIRVLVADDHPAFREGLCRFLAEQADIEIVAQAADGEEAVRLAAEGAPDVAIIGVAMGQVNGVEAARQIKAACPSTAIIILSAFSYEAYVLASLQVGAAGYMLKNAPMDELTSAVRLVSAGEAVFEQKSIGKVLRRIASGDVARMSSAGLHQRELEVLRLAAKGASNRAIGVALDLSDRTIQTHMFNIFRKLEVGSRTEAVLHALKEGWLTVDDLP